MLIFTSKLYRNEIKHWILIVSLFLWATIASFFALQNNTKTILIGVEESNTRIITETNDRILQNELKNFITNFIENYYSFDNQTFSGNISLASDLMIESLWNEKKPKLLEVQERLKTTPLIQYVEIESMDRVDSSRIEAILNLTIKSKLSEHIVKLKVTILFNKTPRTEKNPWGYQIEELSDVTL